MSDRPRAEQVRADHGPLKGQADFDLDPTTHIAGESVHEWLGELLVIRTHAEDPVPASISVVAGREDVQGTDQPSGCGGRFHAG